MVCLQIIIGTSNILLNGDKAMKAKYLIATLILIALFFSHCDNSPTAPQSRTTTTSIKLYANCVHVGGSPWVIPSGSLWGFGGAIENIGQATAYEVRVLWEYYYDSAGNHKFTQNLVYVAPTTLQPGKLGKYQFILTGMPSRFYYKYTVKWR